MAMQSLQFGSMHARSAPISRHANPRGKTLQQPGKFGIGDFKVGAWISYGNLQRQLVDDAARFRRSAKLRARSIQTSMLMYSNSATRPHSGMPICSK